MYTEGTKVMTLMDLEIKREQQFATALHKGRRAAANIIRLAASPRMWGVRQFAPLVESQGQIPINVARIVVNEMIADGVLMPASRLRLQVDEIGMATLNERYGEYLEQQEQSTASPVT